MIGRWLKKEWAQVTTKLGTLLVAVSTIAPQFAAFDVRFAYAGAAAGVLLMLFRERTGA